MMRLLIDLSPCDPALGLGLEEALFDGVRSGDADAVRFWVAQRAVVIGRSQTARAEADLDRLETLGIPLLRRLSGGGAVVHYPGNLNVSLLLGDASVLGSVASTFERLGQALARAASVPGTPVVARGDSLFLHGKKVGGAAQARRGRALLYHTTLLLRPDSIPMAELLLALRPGYRPVGVASCPSPTTTLADERGEEPEAAHLVQEVAAAVGQTLARPVRPVPLSTGEAGRGRRLAETTYRSDEWNLSR